MLKFELSLCEGCKGTCTKSYNRYLVPANEDCDDYKPCRYGIMRRVKAVIPTIYAGLTFGNYTLTAENQRAVAKAKRFCKEPTKGLYLYGAPGTGKTFLASLIAKSFASEGWSVMFKDMPSLLEGIKNTFDDGDTAGLIDRYLESDLLILDDLGAGNMTAWSVGIIYQVINARYNSGKPLIITSNFDLDGLEKRLAGKDAFAAIRITSRLSELAKGFLGTNDRRKKS